MANTMRRSDRFIFSRPARGRHELS